MSRRLESGQRIAETDGGWGLAVLHVRCRSGTPVMLCQCQFLSKTVEVGADVVSIMTIVADFQAHPQWE